MDEYILDLNSTDIGEMVEIIRIQYVKMHSEPFAKKIGMSEKTLLSVENGHSPHSFLALKKIEKAFPSIKIKITVSLP